MTKPLPFKPVLVTGAIRSGSTLIRALLCTAPGTNRLTRPSSHLFALMQPYLEGLSTFDSHAGYFFKDPDAFGDFQATLLRRALLDAWSHLGEPEFLVLGDPTIARGLAALHRMLPEALFAVVLRDPRSVLASRLAVLKRLQGLQHMHNNDISNIRGLMAPICEEYNNYYPFLPEQNERVGLLRYEDICRGDFSAPARLLGCQTDSFDLTGLWQGSELFFPAADPWWSPHFGRELDQTPLRRFEQDLKPVLQKFVTRRCNDIYQRFYGEGHV